MRIDAENHIRCVVGHHRVAAVQTRLGLRDLLFGDVIDRAVDGHRTVRSHHLARDLLSPDRTAHAAGPAQGQVGRHSGGCVEGGENGLPVADVEGVNPQTGVVEVVLCPIPGELLDRLRDVLQAKFRGHLQDEENIEQRRSD